MKCVELKPMHSKHLIGVALMAVLCSPAFAQLSDADQTTQQKCARYLKTALPIEASAIATPSGWPDCDSYKSYSGIGLRVDFNAARSCAWRERLAQQAGEEPRYTVASVLGGSAMLSVLYANGEGVKRDFPLALRFACEASGAPAEVRGRVQSLEMREKTPLKNESKFSFCDDITSGFMEGFCAENSSEIAEFHRARAFEELSAGFTSSQRVAFDALTSAQSAYAAAHGSGEIDLAGTARAMSQIDAGDSLRDDFEAALKAFEHGDVPRGDHVSAIEADRTLNETYRKNIADAETHKSEYGAIQPEGISNAERAWIRYRDAWIPFAKLRYPSLSPDAWLTLLTKDRISVLNGSFCDMDAQEGPCAWQGDTWKPKPLP